MLLLYYYQLVYMAGLAVTMDIFHEIESQFFGLFEFVAS